MGNPAGDVLSTVAGHCRNICALARRRAHPLYRLVFGRFLGQVIKKILGEKNIAWSRAFSGIGLSNILENRLGLSTDVGAFLGWLVKWFLIIASFTAAMSVLQLHAVNSFLGQLVGFLPLAVAAAIIVFRIFLGQIY